VTIETEEGDTQSQGFISKVMEEESTESFSKGEEWGL